MHIDRKDAQKSMSKARAEASWAALEFLESLSFDGEAEFIEINRNSDGPVFTTEEEKKLDQLCRVKRYGYGKTIIQIAAGAVSGVASANPLTAGVSVVDAGTRWVDDSMRQLDKDLLKQEIHRLVNDHEALQRGRDRRSTVEIG